MRMRGGSSYELRLMFENIVQLEQCCSSLMWDEQAADEKVNQEYKNLEKEIAKHIEELERLEKNIPLGKRQPLRGLLDGDGTPYEKDFLVCIGCDYKTKEIVYIVKEYDENLRVLCLLLPNVDID